MKKTRHKLALCNFPYTFKYRLNHYHRDPVRNHLESCREFLIHSDCTKRLNNKHTKKFLFIVFLGTAIVVWPLRQLSFARIVYW